MISQNDYDRTATVHVGSQKKVQESFWSNAWSSVEPIIHREHGKNGSKNSNAKWTAPKQQYEISGICLIWVEMGLIDWVLI